MLRKLNLFFKKRALWEWQYATGQWNVLHSSSENERFDALIELTEEYMEDATILEIGCGEGLLSSRLHVDYRYFLGIDISALAIQKAMNFSNKKTEFMRADMEIFITQKKFDLIIFNESLYYSRKPISLIKRYKSFLSENGLFASSIYDSGGNAKLISRIRKEFDCIKSKTTIGKVGAWYCDVFRFREF